MSCADLRPVIDLLGLGLDDAVESPADLAAGRSHVASCAECAARVASLGGAARALATAPGPPARSTNRDELVARMAAAAAPEPRSGGGAGWLVALVVALVVAAAWAWRVERLTPPTATQPPGELATESEPPAAVTTDAPVFYAQPAPIDEAADPMPALPVGK